MKYPYQERWRDRPYEARQPAFGKVPIPTAYIRSKDEVVHLTLCVRAARFLLSEFVINYLNESRGIS